ncbi:MAG: prolipoprotein diacylglyceryl transferase [Bernardetiaceae bacterium]|nr:prolipoprotein diacylglyceryl transferase [Bernardetiaceae bacterium]
MLSAIIWDADPIIFSLFDGFIELRWYGLAFVTAFLLGYFALMRPFYKREGKNVEDLDILLNYMIAATIIGARLGHCLFYQPEYYLSNPVKILMIWEGGLASHGGAIGILVALYIYSRRHPDQPYLWLLDRIVITVALGGTFIRLGNLMNSEIVGSITDLPWGFVFMNCSDCVMPDGTIPPRHPAQLYESISYFFIFLITLGIYKRTKSQTPQGLIFGIFLILLFGARFVIEFLKKEQVDFEQTMALNMGQILSIPFVLAGAFLLYKALAEPNIPPLSTPDTKNKDHKK